MRAKQKKMAVSQTGVCRFCRAQKYIVHKAPLPTPIAIAPMEHLMNVTKVSQTMALSTAVDDPDNLWSKVSKRTTAAPSLSRASPKIRVYKVSVSLIPTPDKMLRVATGSMDEIREPNNSESSIGKVVPRPSAVSPFVMNPIMTALNTVPKIAKVRIGNRSLRKARLSIFRAEEKMIGGSKILRKRSLSKESLSFTYPLLKNWMIPPIMAPRRIHAAASGIHSTLKVRIKLLSNPQSIKTPTIPSNRIDANWAC
mmetsp:Transcript_16419/g.27811  ORF Transcript_16419/g.27811 Transcript_16419/m.27811 type:complete len:254 (+) Transcript_16419:1386-2147(+)